MDSPTHIDFLTGSIETLPGPIVLYRLKAEPASPDLRQYLKACEIFSANFGMQNKVYAVIVDAREFSTTEEALLDEFAGFYADQQRGGTVPIAFVIPRDVSTLLALESRLSDDWGAPDKTTWFSSAGDAMNAAVRMVPGQRPTIL